MPRAAPGTYCWLVAWLSVSKSLPFELGDGQVASGRIPAGVERGILSGARAVSARICRPLVAVGGDGSVLSQVSTELLARVCSAIVAGRRNSCGSASNPCAAIRTPADRSGRASMERSSIYLE